MRIALSPAYAGPPAKMASTVTAHVSFMFPALVGALIRGVCMGGFLPRRASVRRPGNAETRESARGRRERTNRRARCSRIARRVFRSQRALPYAPVTSRRMHEYRDQTPDGGWERGKY